MPQRGLARFLRTKCKIKLHNCFDSFIKKSLFAKNFLLLPCKQAPLSCQHTSFEATFLQNEVSYMSRLHVQEVWHTTPWFLEHSLSQKLCQDNSFVLQTMSSVLLSKNMHSVRRFVELKSLLKFWLQCEVRDLLSRPLRNSFRCFLFILYAWYDRFFLHKWKNRLTYKHLMVTLLSNEKSAVVALR